MFFAIPHQLAHKGACSTHVLGGVFGHEERVRRSVELKRLGGGENEGLSCVGKVRGSTQKVILPQFAVDTRSDANL